jgi:hypothetical protein
MKTKKKKIAMMIIFVIILKFLANQPDKLKRMNEKAIIDVNYDNILIAIVVFFKLFLTQESSHQPVLSYIFNAFNRSQFCFDFDTLVHQSISTSRTLKNAINTFSRCLFINGST